MENSSKFFYIMQQKLIKLSEDSFFFFFFFNHTIRISGETRPKQEVIKKPDFFT